MGYYVHPSAQVAPDAIIGEGVKIGEGVIIGSGGIRIGDGTEIGEDCILEGTEDGKGCPTVIGRNVLIKKNTTVAWSSIIGDFAEIDENSDVVDIVRSYAHVCGQPAIDLRRPTDPPVKQWYDRIHDPTV